MDKMSNNETSSLVISETQRTKKKNFRQILRHEIHWRSFGFDFPNVDAFYRSQWRWPRLVFVIFRLCLALYTGIFRILTIVYFPRSNPQRPWPVWVTNWSYLLLTCHEIYAAVTALIHSTDRTVGWCCRELEDGNGDDNSGSNRRVANRRKDDPDPLPCYIKLEWLLFCTVSPVALAITIDNLWTPRGDRISVKNLNNHILNSVVILLELCICAIPVRLFHFVYAVVFVALFYLFTYIFWSLDPTGNVLYDFTDWDDPEHVMTNWAVLYLVLPMVVQIIFFLIYRLRLFIYKKIYGDEELGYEDIYDY